MAANESSSEYDVGFGKPPKQTRFRKGTSGNPKGRPPGARSLATVLEQTLRERVIINENGIRKNVTKLEAAVKQLVNQAASGDLIAMRQLTALANAVGSGSADAQKTPVLSEVDLKIMNGILKRFQTSGKGQKKDANDE